MNPIVMDVGAEQGVLAPDEDLFCATAHPFPIDFGLPGLADTEVGLKARNAKLDGDGGFQFPINKAR